MALQQIKKPKIKGLLEDNSYIKAIMSQFAIFPANFWTLLRLAGVYWLISVYQQGGAAVFVVFLGLVITDFIDGKVARIRQAHQITSFKWLDPFWYAMKLRLMGSGTWHKTGSWFDPMVDKVFILSFFYYYGVILMPIMELWFFGALLFLEFSGRLLIIPLGRKLLGKPIIVEANFWGKFKFGSECAAGFLIFLANYNQLFNWVYLAQVTLWLTLALSVFSIINYIFEFHDPWQD